MFLGTLEAKAKEQVKERNVMNDSRLFSPLLTSTSHHKQKFCLLNRVDMKPSQAHRIKKLIL